MIAKIASPSGLSCRGLAFRLPARPAAAFRSSKRHVVVRFRDDEGSPTAADKDTDTKLAPEQVDEMYKKPEGSFSPRTAEIRADLGNSATDLHMMQTFDGPAPETINGRLSMLGVLIGLVGEATTGLGLMEQTADHPVLVFASFIIISIATYAPLIKGYTRKEPFANHFLGLNWSPKAENYNGRLAMMGFLGMVLTEWAAGCTTLQAYGLQPHSLGL